MYSSTQVDVLSILHRGNYTNNSARQLFTGELVITIVLCRLGVQCSHNWIILLYCICIASYCPTTRVNLHRVGIMLHCSAVSFYCSALSNNTIYSCTVLFYYYLLLYSIVYWTKAGREQGTTTIDSVVICERAPLVSEM